MFDKKWIEFGRELIDVIEKYNEPHTVPIIPEKDKEEAGPQCNHEPRGVRSQFEVPADGMFCKHCGVNIKPERWMKA